jgi:hypothetical protein
MDPNTSLLRMFDPIHGNATPVRLESHSNNDDFTMSTFFNKISSKRLPSDVPSLSGNRQSLIDLSFDSLSKPDGDEPTPTKHIVARSIAPLMPKSSAPLLQDSTEIHTPKNVGAVDATQFSKSSLNEKRHVAGNAHLKRPPPSPSKFSHHLTVNHATRHSRRSSLDVSSLTLNIKDRLAQDDMSFDIINDEISILSELTEGDPPAPVTNHPQLKSSIVPKTAPAMYVQPSPSHAT